MENTPVKPALSELTRQRALVSLELARATQTAEALKLALPRINEHKFAPFEVQRGYAAFETALIEVSLLEDTISIIDEEIRGVYA